VDLQTEVCAMMMQNGAYEACLRKDENEDVLDGIHADLACSHISG
jgi:hypothetical protein